MLTIFDSRRRDLRSDRVEPDDALLERARAFAPEADREAFTMDRVHMRSAYVCNDQVDHYSTRFTIRALHQIAAIINDQSAGFHRNHATWGSQDLPVGRWFHAEVVEIDGVHWVRAWFYCARGDEMGDRLERYVSLGIWREVSISWWMRSYTCDVDGLDVSKSPHYPGQVLEGGRVVVGVMDDIAEVDEISAVPQGGQKGTKFAERSASERQVDDLMGRLRIAREEIVDAWRLERSTLALLKEEPDGLMHSLRRGASQ